MVSHDVLFLQSTKVLSGFHPDDGGTPSEEESQFQHSSDDCGSPACAGSCAQQPVPAIGHKGPFEFEKTPRAHSGTGGFVERAMCSPFRLGDEKKNRGKSMKKGGWMRAALFLSHEAVG